MLRRVALLVGVVALGTLGCDTLRARHLASRGAEAYKRGDFRAASESYEQAVRLDGTIDTLHLNLGFTYAQLCAQSSKQERTVFGGRAIDELKEYLSRRPGDERARNYLVQTFVDTNRYDEAVAWFKPLTDRSPPDLEAIATLGQIAARTNRIEQALSWYELRVKTNPGDADGPYNLGVLVWDYLHQHAEIKGPARLALADRGLAALRRAIALRPKAPNGYTYLSLVYRERAAGQPDEAARAADLAEAEANLKTALDLRKDEPPTATVKR